MNEQIFLNGKKSKEPTIQIQKTTYLKFGHTCANQAPITNHPVTQRHIPNKDLKCTTAKKPNDSLKQYCKSTSYTGHFIMFSVITSTYNKKTKGPTLMELFTATGKLKKFLFLTTRDVRCVHHG
jgi:hypothetical protein